ncbi:hypothetical protein GWI33_011921 [Rhynchophorus ferrugineus]|uniref:Uncharacterized protein n=1 Tax=Rhynchophorus ferrugineus TaxID=354439 RepID=A0A834IWD0_RHYFE|nr:hypothetical protein GWI33_011921 [Rhynchophorus ferrugineus]
METILKAIFIYHWTRKKTTANTLPSLFAAKLLYLDQNRLNQNKKRNERYSPSRAKNIRRNLKRTNEKKHPPGIFGNPPGSAIEKSSQEKKGTTKKKPNRPTPKQREK